MKKIAVMISGSGSNLEAIVKACHEKNIYGEIVYVISNNPDAYGIERAKKYNIPVKIIDHKSYTDRDVAVADMKKVFQKNINLLTSKQSVAHSLQKLLLWEHNIIEHVAI